MDQIDFDLANLMRIIMMAPPSIHWHTTAQPLNAKFIYIQIDLHEHKLTKKPLLCVFEIFERAYHLCNHLN